jgi:hypothetical protein
MSKYMRTSLFFFVETQINLLEEIFPVKFGFQNKVRGHYYSEKYSDFSILLKTYLILYSPLKRM